MLHFETQMKTQIQHAWADNNEKQRSKHWKIITTQIQTKTQTCVKWEEITAKIKKLKF